MDVDFSIGYLDPVKTRCVVAGAEDHSRFGPFSGTVEKRRCHERRL